MGGFVLGVSGLLIGADVGGAANGDHAVGVIATSGKVNVGSVVTAARLIVEGAFGVGGGGFVLGLSGLLIGADVGGAAKVDHAVVVRATKGDVHKGAVVTAALNCTVASVKGVGGGGDDGGGGESLHSLFIYYNIS